MIQKDTHMLSYITTNTNNECTMDWSLTVVTVVAVSIMIALFLLSWFHETHALQRHINKLNEINPLIGKQMTIVFLDKRHGEGDIIRTGKCIQALPTFIQVESELGISTVDFSKMKSITFLN